MILATDWYFSKNGNRHGPVTSAQLKALAGAGKLLPTDLVWKEGVSSWKPAGKVKGLFPAVPVAVAVPSPPVNAPELASAARGFLGAVTATAKRVASMATENANGVGLVLVAVAILGAIVWSGKHFSNLADDSSDPDGIPSWRSYIVSKTSLKSAGDTTAEKKALQAATSGKTKDNSAANMTVDEFRKAVDFQEDNSWSPKQTFYDKFGQPQRVTTVESRINLYYQCKDSTAKVECNKGAFEYEDRIWIVGISQSN